MSNRLKTYFIRTFGCQANRADSEKIAGFLEAAGFKPAKKIDNADWVIINTCSVRQTAEDRVLGLVRNLKEFAIRPPKARLAKGGNSQFAIILTGCMLYRPIADLKKKLPEVNWFVKTNEWPDFLKERFKIKSSNHEVGPKREEKIHAWVPIMEGCNNFCSYCVVPYARGRENSRPLEEIACEVEKLAKQGYREITLLGQNVNAYKSAKNNFAEVLQRLNRIPGLKKISFITSNPWDLTDEIIQSIKLPKIDKYLHLPVQSGDDKVLRRMNRPYTAVQYIKLIKKIRREIPQIKIGTDIIVGFPGETEKQFKKTVELCKKVGFEKAYIAKYSPRPGTTAFKFGDDISYQEKKRRWKILEELINKKKPIG